MFIKFADNKCPVCGDSGSKIDSKLFECKKCDTAYDSFGIFGIPKEDESFWN